MFCQLLFWENLSTHPKLLFWENLSTHHPPKIYPELKILRGTSFNPSPIWAQSSQNSGTHSCRKKTQNFEIYPPKPIDIAFTLVKTETSKYDYLDRTHLHQRDVSIYFQCKYSNYSEQIQFIFNANTIYSVYIHYSVQIQCIFTEYYSVPLLWTYNALSKVLE